MNAPVPHTVAGVAVTSGLSDHDRDRIVEMAEAGLKSCTIAKAIGKHPSAVCSFMYVAGLQAPGPARTTVAIRNGKIVKPFGPDEDAFITRLRVDGLGTTRIAAAATERFGHPRTKRTIHQRLVMLAARDEMGDAPLPLRESPRSGQGEGAGRRPFEAAR
ncbi:hypothetical protein DFR50_15917 [Roseiarcus fermentans]|uniref:Uncharacterized protein n=1 Tax=Roseiarcus fermentans TaxID=1473586 RepID=A0A366EFA3_9HYPH|nr:hypothetical protein [Roseiarcus fermentans]RBP01072.1 hypothetical protein DFR50_15917 [Roseiarcus fermentans]